MRSDLDTFDDLLNQFLNFCENDEVFSSVHKQLISVPGVDFDQWYIQMCNSVGSFVGSGSLVFPTNTDARLALQYEILRRINQHKLSYLDFTTNFFSVGSQISEHIRALNDAITRPLVREMEYRLESVVDRLPNDRGASVPPTTIQIIQHATNVIQQNANGNNISQSASISLSADLSTAFEDLRNAVKKNESDLRKLDEHLEAISAAEELASSQNPKTSVIKTIFDSLPKVAAVGTITMTILKLLSL
jgi:hypothetical protein